MSADTGTPASRAASVSRSRGNPGLRRASLAAFVILLAQYGLGLYVNLYVTVPAADHGHGLARAIAEGPSLLTAHVLTGLLLIVSALYAGVWAWIARRRAPMALAVAALLAIVAATAAGSSFVGGGKAAASLAMGALTAVALLCYGLIVYLVPSRQPGQP